MAGKIQAVAAHVVSEYGGDTERLWKQAPGGAELVKRIEALPGFGRQKSQIFAALVGKQLGVRPVGWAQAVGPYAEEGTFRSVADVVDASSLEKVRAYKKAKRKAAAS